MNLQDLKKPQASCILVKSFSAGLHVKFQLETHMTSNGCTVVPTMRLQSSG